FVRFKWSPLRSARLDPAIAFLTSSCRREASQQEPSAPLRFVDPVLDQARGRHVAMLVGKVMGLSQVRDELFIVLAQLGQQVERGDVVGFFVEHALQPCDVANRAQGSATDLAHALGNVVGGGKNLLGLLVKEMTVAGMRHLIDDPEVASCFRQDAVKRLMAKRHCPHHFSDSFRTATSKPQAIRPALQKTGGGWLSIHTTSALDLKARVGVLRAGSFVIARDCTADGLFWYSVLTTGVYCRP